MKPPKLTREQAQAAGRKGGAKTAELRREGKIGPKALPLIDAKQMAADIRRMIEED